MNPYETTLILDPQLQEEGWEKVIEKYSAIITAKGTIKRTDRWGLRRLAYEIKKHTQGYYVQIIHESPSATPRAIERQCVLDEQCLRYMTVVGDNPKYLEEQDNKRTAREQAAEPAARKPAEPPAEAPAVAAAAEASPSAPDEPVGEAKSE